MPRNSPGIRTNIPWLNAKGITPSLNASRTSSRTFSHNFVTSSSGSSPSSVSQASSCQLLRSSAVRPANAPAALLFLSVRSKASTISSSPGGSPSLIVNLGAWTWIGPSEGNSSANKFAYSLWVMLRSSRDGFVGWGPASRYQPLSALNASRIFPSSKKL